MSEKKVLSDDDVYELLHQAYLLLSNKTVATEMGRSVLATAIRDLDILQKALIIMKEGTTLEGVTDPPQPS